MEIKMMQKYRNGKLAIGNDQKIYIFDCLSGKICSQRNRRKVATEKERDTRVQHAIQNPSLPSLASIYSSNNPSNLYRDRPFSRDVDINIIPAYDLAFAGTITHRCTVSVADKFAKFPSLRYRPIEKVPRGSTRSSVILFSCRSPASR